MCITMACLITGLSLTAPVLGTEPIEEMRSFARMSVLVETRDQKGFCAAMVADPSYVGYVNRACQFAVKNKLKKPEDCSPENIAREISADSDRCLTMSAAMISGVRSAGTITTPRLNSVCSIVLIPPA